MRILFASTILVIAVFALDLPAAAGESPKPETNEYHVSASGDDANDGSAAQPLRTISAAAQRAQPGDVITVHEGVYRERDQPAAGRESDAQADRLSGRRRARRSRSRGRRSSRVGRRSRATPGR